MKLLVVLAVLGVAAAAEDQQADDSTFVTTYAAHTGLPLAYTAGYAGHYAPTVYSSAYSPLAYPHLYTGAYHGYTAPLVHSLKKRDTAAAAEDQQADDSTFVTTYAGHTGLPLAYSAGYAGHYAPTVYSSAYSSLAYPHLYTGAYHGYTAPLVHSLKKRDTAAAEGDQQADDSTFVTTYAGHTGLPLAYSAGYAGHYAPAVYSSAYSLRTPASTVPVTYNALPFGYGHALL